MTAVFLRQNEISQPTSQVQLDPTWCPEGSVVCTPFFPVTRVGNPTIVANSSGIAFGNPSAGNYWQAASSKVVSNKDVFTLAVLFASTRGVVGGGYALLGERGSSGNDICKLVFSENLYTNNTVGAVIRNSAGLLRRINGPGTVCNDGLPHTAVYRKAAANSHTVYIDGVPGGTDTTNYPGSGFTGNTPLTICYDLADSGKAFEGVALAVAIPNFAWSPEQIRQFAINPWQIFYPHLRPIAISLAGGGATIITLNSASFGIAAQGIQPAFDLSLANTSLDFTSQDMQTATEVTLGSSDLNFTPQDITVGSGTVIELVKAAFNFTANTITTIADTVITLTTAAFNFSAKNIVVSGLTAVASKARGMMMVLASKLRGRR